MLEDLKPASTIRNTCKVIQRVEEHPDTTDKDVELIRQYLDDPNWGDASLANALTKKGIKVNRDSVRRHRDKRCPCSTT
jgi:hypothetical protein